MQRVRSPLDEKVELLARSTALVDRRLRAVASDLIRGSDSTESVSSLAALLAETMALADLIGRRRMLLEFDAFAQRVQPQRFMALDAELSMFASTPVVPHIPFDEAIRDMIARDPRLAQSAEAVAALYRERHAFAMARSSEEVLTARIQEMIARFMRRGATVPSASEQIAEVGDFTRAYAETVYRTNLATAYEQGRRQQALDPDIEEVVPALRFSAVLDSDVRANHAAADGLIASTRDAVWGAFTPPIGYNCRCTTEFVDRWELEQMGLLMRNGQVRTHFPATFASAFPDKGFEVKPNIYG